jgi:hypothetical protein
MIESKQIKRLVRNVLTTRPDEIGCEECLARMDRFVEMELEGKDPAQAMPLVQHHLERCRDCHEEFEALMTVLRKISRD